MRRSLRMRWMLVAAVSAVGAIAIGQAQAQYRVETGRATDANPQVGSGGYNTGNIPAPGTTVTGNDIVTGNVTGGKEFRGRVPYAAPQDFRGNLGSASFDPFIARSSGVPMNGMSPLQSDVPRVFYGNRTVDLPPGGVTELGATGAYVPTPQPRKTPEGLNSQLVQGMPLSDLSVRSPRLGDVLLMPGPIDPQTQLPSVLTASPLMGVRTWNPASEADRNFLSGYTNWSPETAMRLNMPLSDVLRLREDVAKSAGVLGQGTTETKPEAGGNLARPMLKPFESPENPAIGGVPLQGNITESPLRGDIRADQALSWRLVTPAQQSTQYAELEKRLSQYYADRLQTDEDRNREIIKLLRAREKETKTAPGTTPESAPKPKTEAPDYGKITKQLLEQSKLTPPAGTEKAEPSMPAGKPQPLKIESLAIGVKAEGLARLITKAEDLMKEGKYMAALEQYGLAERVVPNNSMVWIGSAHAELAAGFFKRAELHIRQALTADPVLTMAQFSLKAQIPKERLETIVRDLKELARTNEKDPGPALLLAYLAYNTGNEAQAGTYLDLADKRAGGHDALVKILKMNWKIDGGPTTRPGK